MSGGVDSSVTAALLVECGFEVVGITLQLYNHGAAVGRKGACCAGRDIYDAAQVAERLGIAHYVLDYESRFRAEVVEDFVDSYRRGETPVPCIRCNQRVKFRDLLGAARDLGASALATGHYARRIAGPDGSELHRARDATRDQSYFLFATTRAELDFLRFPLGGLTKTRRVGTHGAFASRSRTRRIARISASSRRDPMPAWSSVCARRLVSRATSSIRRDACSAAIAALPISPSGNARGSGLPPRSRSMC
jgi:tRNA U34 2-thiouridine synthase MnmA/TrmU